MSTAATFNEFQWRSHSVSAGAGQVVGQVAARVQRGVSVGVIHLRTRYRLGRINSTTAEILGLFHDPAYIDALEAATPEQLGELLPLMREANQSVDWMIAQLRGLPLRYWTRFYTPVLTRLETLNREWAHHVAALEDTASQVLLLTPRSQQALLESLIATPVPEPSAALRRAFGR